VSWRLKDEKKIIEIGRNFCVAPPDYDTDRIKITLTDGYSFGTGVHETTKSCMAIMEDIDLKGKSFLDVGIGSGILSIAALKLGALEAVGFDIHRFAVEECIGNGRLNNVNNLHCFVSDRLSSIKGSFDIIAANIFGDIILSMGQDIVRLSKPSGYLLLSGVIVEDNFAVKKFFTEHGFEVIKNLFLEEYTTLLLKREV